jgi:hypothetical protein
MPFEHELIKSLIVEKAIVLHGRLDLKYGLRRSALSGTAPLASASVR